MACAWDAFYKIKEDIKKSMDISYIAYSSTIKISIHAEHRTFGTIFNTQCCTKSVIKIWQSPIILTAWRWFWCRYCDQSSMIRVVLGWTIRPWPPFGTTHFCIDVVCDNDKQSWQAADVGMYCPWNNKRYHISLTLIYYHSFWFSYI